MAEAREKVVIEVEIDADISNDLAGIERRLKALEDRQRALNRATRGASDANRDFDASGRSLRKTVDSKTQRFQRFESVLKRFGRGLQKVTGFLQKFLMTFSKLSFIAIAAEVALFTAGLLAVKALLVTGRVAVKGYNLALKGLSVTATAVATGLAVAAAAIREFQEVQLSPFFGGGRQGARGARQLNRSITSQTRSLLGESTGAIAGSLGQAGVARGNALATQLFNLTGGDAKAAQSLAAAFASAKKSGNTAGLVTSLQGAQGFRKDSISSGATLSSIIGTVSSGGATADAFQGVAQDMAATFIGTLKSEAESFKTIFATIGEPLLAPFRDSFVQISRIIKNDVLGIAQIMRDFGPDSMAPALVGFVDAIGEFVRSNIVNNVSDIAGAADKFIDFFRSVGNFFTGFGDWLRSYEGAANVVIDMLKAMFGRSAGGLFRDFANLIEDNRETFVGFGDAIGNVLNAIKNGFLSGQRGFFASLPRLTNTLNVVATSVLPNLFEVFGAIAPLFESFPELIRNVSEKLGPMLVRIFEAMKPIFDKLPEAFSGLMKVLSALEPVIMLLIKAVDLLMSALGSIPLIGNMLMGGGMVYMLGGKTGGAFLNKFGGRTGRAVASTSRNIRSSAEAGAGRLAASGRMGRAGAAADDIILRMAESRNPAIRGMGNTLLNNFRTTASGSGLTGALQKYLTTGEAGSVSLRGFLSGQSDKIFKTNGFSRLQQFGFNARLTNGRAFMPLSFRGNPLTYPITGNQVHAFRIPQMTMPGQRMNQTMLSGIQKYNAAKGRFPRVSAGNVASKAFGGIAAYQTIGDLMDGQLYNKAAENPLGAALQYGGAASLVGGGALVGGATAAVGSVANINRYGASIGNVGTGLLGAAVAGGSLLGPAGAIGAVLVTGISMAISSYARGKRIRKNAEEMGDSLLSGIADAFKGGEIKNGLTDVQRNTFSSLFEAGMAAQQAGTNDKLEMTEGDTRAMREFILEAQASGLLAGTEFENMALSEFHLDDFFTKVFPKIMQDLENRLDSDMRRRQREEELRIQRIDSAVGKLASTLEVSRKEIERFVADFGIALDTANLAGVEALFGLYNSPIIDLAQGFLPDLSQTTAAGLEAKAGVNAALNVLADADKTGQYNTADLSSFIENYTAAEVSMGGNAAVSGLSAIMELQRQVSTGALSGNFATMFNLDQLLGSTAQEMATSFGVPVEAIMAAIGTGDVDNVTAYLEDVGASREIARAGVFGTGTAEQRTAYLNQNAASLVEDDAFKAILRDTIGLDLATEGASVRGSMDYEAILRNQAEQGNLPEIMQRYLTEVGDGNDKSYAALLDIKTAIDGVSPMVSIEGKPGTRAGQDGATFDYTVTVTAAPTS